jgi:hypothetical protein
MRTLPPNPVAASRRAASDFRLRLGTAIPEVMLRTDLTFWRLPNFKAFHRDRASGSGSALAAAIT